MAGVTFLGRDELGSYLSNRISTKSLQNARQEHSTKALVINTLQKCYIYNTLANILQNKKLPFQIPGKLLCNETPM